MLLIKTYTIFDSIKIKPPYKITSDILSSVVSISEKLGEVKTAHLNQAPAELRRENRIKTIQSSLEIEGNTMTVEQITDLLNNKRVLAPQKDIQEVKNAVKLYNQLDKLNPYSLTSLLKAHKLLMTGLIDEAGKLRRSDVGIAKGDTIAHIAPPPHLVKFQIENLLQYAEDESEPILIRSCVFHYEFKFIHPFLDGNGRMGRLWQTLLLRQEYPVFEYLPIETLIKKSQAEYYEVLSKCDKQGVSTLFIEYMLIIIDEALEELLSLQRVKLIAKDRINIFRNTIKAESFSRKEYMLHFKDISSATASRDLREATKNGELTKMGDGRVTTYKFVL